MRSGKPSRVCSHFILPVLTLMMLFAASPSCGESADNRDAQLFMAGLKAYQLKDFEGAASSLSQVVTECLASPLRDMSLLWLAKTRYREGNQPEAARYLAQFFREYPDSPAKVGLDGELARLVPAPLPPAKPDPSPSSPFAASTGDDSNHSVGRELAKLVPAPLPPAKPGPSSSSSAASTGDSTHSVDGKLAAKPVPAPLPPAKPDTASPSSAASTGADSADSVVEGFATYYGSHFIGKKTASGQPYRPEKLTAAFPDFPLGTRVRVVNLSNGREVVVTVNDRCPTADVPWITLSRAAAQSLGFLGHKPAKVRIFPPEKL